jgi:hypothetical protein
MTPFRDHPHDARTTQQNRAVLLAQAPEFFKPYCRGRVRSLPEKLQVVENMVQRMSASKSYINDLYMVQIDKQPPSIHLIIQRLDGQTCKEWSHFQKIKNELVGPEFEAVELYPADSRLVDTRNEYHLWVLADPTKRLPFGYDNRLVWDTPLR